MLDLLEIDADIAGILLEVQESLNMPLKAMVLSIKSQTDGEELPTEPPFIAVLPK